MNKKAISPIIATAILVAIVMTLAVIIWIFLSSFVSELVIKQGKPASTVCIDNVRISVDVDFSRRDDKIVIVNDGSSPIAGFTIKSGGEGSYYECVLDVGDSSSSVNCNIDIVNCNNKMKITPSILGTGETSGENKLFNCETASVEVSC
ncbi:MAG: hypothetical protein KJ767_00585 [Nanoarchaeota archaeon]|nr:hypothetical protein [Nanoarchaeota archaeon]